jgi:hypothetical protein
MIHKDISTKNRRAGFYWIDNKPHLSVTQILKVPDKPALRYWYGQQVYRAVQRDPSLSEQEALAIPYTVGKQAMSRGTQVHEIIENWAHKRLVQEPELEPYVHAFESFMKEHQVVLVDHEQTVVSSEHRYAGTLDLVATLGGKKFFIDVKTNKDGNVYVEAGLQLSAYKYAHGEDYEIAVVSLSAKGKYTFQTMNYDIEAFLACKKLYEYLNHDLLVDIGYL